MRDAPNTLKAFLLFRIPQRRSESFWNVYVRLFIAANIIAHSGHHVHTPKSGVSFLLRCPLYENCSAREHSSERSRERSEESCAKVGEQEKAMAGTRERAGKLLGRCEGTVASLVAQLELVLSPECVEDGGYENIVRTAIAREAGCRRSSA